MSEQSKHSEVYEELYEAISDLIFVCDDHALPRTQEMLMVCIGMLCNEGGRADSSESAEIYPFQKSIPPAAAMRHASAGYLS